MFAMVINSITVFLTSSVMSFVRHVFELQFGCEVVVLALSFVEVCYSSVVLWLVTRFFPNWLLFSSLILALLQPSKVLMINILHLVSNDRELRTLSSLFSFHVWIEYWAHLCYNALREMFHFLLGEVLMVALTHQERHLVLLMSFNMGWLLGCILFCIFWRWCMCFILIFFDILTSHSYA